MKNPFKHFIKHLECKLYVNPKNDNYNINMQTSKQLLYHFLQKKSKFKLNPKTKNI